MSSSAATAEKHRVHASGLLLRMLCCAGVQPRLLSAICIHLAGRTASRGAFWSHYVPLHSATVFPTFFWLSWLDPNFWKKIGFTSSTRFCVSKIRMGRRHDVMTSAHFPTCARSFLDMCPAIISLSWYKSSIFVRFPRITGNIIGIPAKRLGFPKHLLVPGKDAAKPFPHSVTVRSKAQSQSL